jgi:phosphate starvation-inducible membrane PsiE
VNRVEFSPAVLTKVFRAAEVVVLVMIAVLLITLSVFLLLGSAFELVRAVQQSGVVAQATSILDNVLLVMMTMEIVYTVTLQIQIRRLVPEPFLVIGAVSAVRRMLIVTTNAAQIPARDVQIAQNVLLELAVLSLIVLVMVVSIYILRRAPPALAANDAGDE